MYSKVLLEMSPELNLLKQRAERTRQIVTAIDQYDENVTALARGILVVIVAVVGVIILTGFAALMLILCSGLTMVLAISKLLRSPAVQKMATLSLPRSVVVMADSSTAQKIVSVSELCGRRTLPTLVKIIFKAYFVFASIVFFAAECLGPVLCSPKPTESVGDDSCRTDSETVEEHDNDPLTADREMPSVEDSAVAQLVTEDGPVNSGNLQICVESGHTELSSEPKPSDTTVTFKFWKRRYSLFSKFDLGVMLDEESFYSVCPEVLSTYMAQKCRGTTVAVDPFCGAGGNIIQLAKYYDKVIAIDIDPGKIQLARHNCAIYGVSHKIEFVVGDFFCIQGIKADVLVTSPPWGGPAYSQKAVVRPTDLYVDKILSLGKKMAPKILLHLPKNMDKTECLQVGYSTGVEIKKIENVFIDKYLNCTLMYGRSNNNNSVNDVSAQQRYPQPIDVHLRNSFRKNENCNTLITYQRYLMDVDRFLSSRRSTSILA